MRRLLFALAGVLALVAAGCDLQKVVPPGDAPLRYRDTVFTVVTTTRNVAYGAAVDQQGAHRRHRGRPPRHRLGARRLVRVR